MPFVVGLTGGIGSGKSTVASCFSECGAKVIDADDISRVLTQSGSPVLDELAQAFGADILNSEGQLNRSLLAERAFASQELTETLNSIMHPKIREVALSQIKGQPDNVIVVYDMPLLVETGSENLCDLVVVVTAPVEQRISRLTASRSMSIADIQQRIAQQSPDSVRVKAADFIITNQGSLEDLYAQCKPVWALILDAAHQSTRRTLS
jgi:dephospho-CoA kinase